MQWQDRGLVLSTRRFGERDCILEVMTPHHGRHLGLVRAGRSSRHVATLQPGNTLALTWRARLEDHLGNFTAETLESRAALVLGEPLALHAMTHIGALLRLLPERSPHPHVYEAAEGLSRLFVSPLHLAPMLVRFELMMLSELGFGLDLSECAATGEREDLCYVSPKSSRAVCRAAGEPWSARLLPLPDFVKPEPELPDATPPRDDVMAGFTLSGYFLERHVFTPRGIAVPPARAAMLALLDAQR